MRVLSFRPGRSSAELARDINVSPQAMNIVLRGLQDAGGHTPRQGVLGPSVTGSADGRRQGTVEAHGSRGGVADERVMANLTPAERREFKRILASVGST